MRAAEDRNILRVQAEIGPRIARILGDLNQAAQIIRIGAFNAENRA